MSRDSSTPSGDDTAVSLLRSAIAKGPSSLATIPRLLKRILKEGHWRDRIETQTGERIQFDRFEDFVVALPLEGLGATVQLLKDIVKRDDEATSLLDQELQRGPGGSGINQWSKQFEPVSNESGNVDNVHNSTERPTGNSKERALRKLRTDAPEIHDRVLKGELSPHAGMIEAGFRRKATALDGLKANWTKATEAEREEFLAWANV